MRTVWKFEIPFSHQAEAPHSAIRVPPHAIPVLVGIDASNGKPAIWIEVDTTLEPTSRRFVVYGTGAELPDMAIHRGSFFSKPYVWHVYEVPA
jgi:hypothetical protein